MLSLWLLLYQELLRSEMLDSWGGGGLVISVSFDPWHTTDQGGAVKDNIDIKLSNGFSTGSVTSTTYVKFYAYRKI